MYDPIKILKEMVTKQTRYGSIAEMFLYYGPCRKITECFVVHLTFSQKV